MKKKETKTSSKKGKKNRQQEATGSSKRGEGQNHSKSSTKPGQRGGGQSTTWSAPAKPAQGPRHSSESQERKKEETIKGTKGSVGGKPEQVGGRAFGFSRFKTRGEALITPEGLKFDDPGKQKKEPGPKRPYLGGKGQRGPG